MIGHKNYLQADYLLGPGPRLIKKKLPGRGLTKVEKHWSRLSDRVVQFVFVIYNGDDDNRFLLQTDNDLQADTLL
jgi:hypothetical protein